MKIKYGSKHHNIDVTDICHSKLLQKNIITIPDGDHNRAKYFSDPLVGVVKSIFIIGKDNETTEHDATKEIRIDINNATVTVNSIDEKITQIHSNLKIKYGSFNEELPEQKMVARYLIGNEKVLEIGGNIGRNSLVIAYILGQNNGNLVTLESDPEIAKQLKYNKELNGFNFSIEDSALSKRKLIQSGWNTLASDVLLPEYNFVKTITLNELNKKYNIVFDTLVLDCEGAFYYILMDMPDILNNINLIIMENDYHNISHKEYIDNILKTNNFVVDYTESGGWGCCYHNFYEVWKRQT